MDGHHGSSDWGASQQKARLQQRNPAQLNAWVQRVHSVQTARLSPSKRESIRQQADQQRKFLQMRREVHRQKKCADRVHGAVWGMSGALQCMKQARMDEGDTAVRHRSAGWAMQAQQEMAQAADDYVQAPDDAYEEEAAVALPGAPTGAQEEAERRNEVDDQLSELRKEPPSDEERAAKFEIYEAYGNRVSATRNDLFSFWNTNKNDFPDNVRPKIGKELDGVDDVQRTGIFDRSRFWFVHDMMKQASSNHVHMAGLLRDVRTRLSLLADDAQPECPICLAPFKRSGQEATDGDADESEEPVEAELLSCCHRVCKECWENWVDLKGQAAFCPLCKHQEFIQELAMAVGSD